MGANKVVQIAKIKNYTGYNYREQFNCGRMPVVNSREIWTTMKANQLL